MNIAIDISQTAFKGSGVARYTHTLVESLVQSCPEGWTYTFFYSSLRIPPAPELVQLITSPHKLVHMRIPPSVLAFMWNTLHIVPIEWLVGRHDFVISSDWTQPPVSHGKAFTIVHDLIPLLFPQTSTTKTTIDVRHARLSSNIVTTHTQRLARVKEECDLIIADSYSTKADIARLLDIELKKIHVIYPAVTFCEVTPDDVKRVKTTHQLTKPYIVAVGKLEPRKNLESLISAFAQSSLATSHELVLIGSTGWGSVQARHEGVRHLGFVTDSELFALYKGATMCAMPSLYEGFGFPVLEAMAVGCPVACSNTSSLGEIAKDFAVTFDPTDVSSIQKGLEKLYALIQTGKLDTHEAQKYARSFTKKAFAHAFVDTMREVYS